MTAKIEPVTSASNPLLKDVRRATVRGGLTSQGLCVAESFHLLEEARRSGCAVPIALVAESAEPRYISETNSAGAPPDRTVVLPDRLFQTVATTETSQGVIALVRPPEWSMRQLLTPACLVVVLDGIQDPGNAGAIARAAEAFGASGMIFLKGAVSPFHPKTLRASAGSFFRIPFIFGIERFAVRRQLESERAKIFAAMPFTGAAQPADKVDLTGSCAIVIGSEGRGIGEELLSVASPVAIPTTGVESLNAAVAAAVLLYEAARQRRERS